MERLGDRGTGRTSKQMLEAPKGANFVWCNQLTDYPRELARHLGRSDLRIVPAPRNQMDLVSLGLIGPRAVVYDHAYGLV